MGKRGYYRVSKKCPANRIDGIFAGIIQTKFAEGWPKARIAREFRLNRRTVARICSIGSKSSVQTALLPCTDSKKLLGTKIPAPSLPILKH